MSIQALLDELRLDPSFMRRVAAWQVLPARPAQLAPFPAGLDARLIAGLEKRGIAQLYSHQAAAVQAALQGENVVVVTPTASGKTLCYNLPVLQTMLEQPEAQALYLFPTKALAQDQAAELAELTEAIGVSVPVTTYDGDTPKSHRSAARRLGGVVISNPDMLHTGILPHHTRWAALFANLRYVVLDELHTYRGIFGSHMANVLRRLRRIATFYGSQPQFIAASATIANPAEHAHRLLEAPVQVIAEDGAPRGEKHFLLLNPPLVDPSLGIRRSVVLEARDIAGRFLAARIQTLVFTRARLTAELLLGYLQDEITGMGYSARAIRGYRGGYLPEERREIERELRTGQAQGVVATNALELGVDIGSLGAVVMTGYPGTIASTWQQAGRSGRRNEVSAAVLIASGSPLDQYLVAHPRYLFERTPEHARINPDNPAIVLNHIRCAVFELPFQAREAFGEFGDSTPALEVLAEEGLVRQSTDRSTNWRSPDRSQYHWVDSSYPAEGLSLRTGTDDTVVIQTVTDRPVVIGEIDRPSAPRLVHEGAIYVHEGRQYLVKHLDWEGRRADVRPVEVDYYTDASESVEVRITEVQTSEDLGATRRSLGELKVTSQVTGFRKIRRYTHETLGYAQLDMPPQEMDTTGYWLTIAAGLSDELLAQGLLQAPNDYGPNWPLQRDAARARDGYRCRNCSAPERDGRQHEVHHLTPFRTFGYIRGQNDAYRQANRLENLVTLCPSCHRQAEASLGSRSALAGLGNALRNLAPLYLMCDPHDINVVSESRSPQTRLPTITFYESVPSGIGFSEQLYELHPELLAAALELLRSCPCDSGCPACVGPVGEVGYQAKALAIRLAERIAQ